MVRCRSTGSTKSYRITSVMRGFRYHVAHTSYHFGPDSQSCVSKYDKKGSPIRSRHMVIDDTTDGWTEYDLAPSILAYATPSRAASDAGIRGSYSMDRQSYSVLQKPSPVGTATSVG